MKSQSQLVSVILPTYNRVELLKETIESVLNQSYKNIELIIVDDGSSDGTYSYVTSLKDDRIIFISQENLGRSKARNAGLKASTGKLISFIDSDDLFLPKKIELQVNFLNRNPQYDFVYTSAACFKGNSTEVPVHHYWASSSGDIYEEIAAYIPLTICLPTVMFQRKVLEAVGMFDTNLDRFEDTDYWRRVSQKFRIGGMAEITCLIRTHEGNSIDGLSTQTLRKQVLKYGKKILSNDLGKHGYIVFSLVSNFYRHYAWAIASNSPRDFNGYFLYFKSELLQRKYLYKCEVEAGGSFGRIICRMSKILVLRFVFSFKQLLKKLLGRNVVSFIFLLKARVKRLVHWLNDK